MRQTLLVAPCGHLFHYKCVTPLLGRVIFACPLCRDTADLHASVESFVEDSDSDDDDDGQAQLRRKLADVALSEPPKLTFGGAAEPATTTTNDPPHVDHLTSSSGAAHETGRRTLVNPDLPPAMEARPSSRQQSRSPTSSSSSLALSPELLTISQTSNAPPLLSPTFSEQANVATRPPSQYVPDDQ